MDRQEMIAEHDNGDEWPAANSTLRQDYAVQRDHNNYLRLYWHQFAEVALFIALGVAIGLVILNH